MDYLKINVRPDLKAFFRIIEFMKRKCKDIFKRAGRCYTQRCAFDLLPGFRAAPAHGVGSQTSYKVEIGAPVSASRTHSSTQIHTYVDMIEAPIDIAERHSV